MDLEPSPPENRALRRQAADSLRNVLNPPHAMDEFIIDYFEGGFDYDHHYDPDLHRDLEIELGHAYNDGPFAALADAVGLEHDYDDHDDYEIEYREYRAGFEQGRRDFGGGDLDDRSLISGSSVPDSVDRATDDSHEHHYRTSDDGNSEDEAVLERYGESWESDRASLPSSEDSSQDEEGSQVSTPEHGGAHPRNARLEEPLIEIPGEEALISLGASNEALANFDDFTDEEVFDEFSEDEVLANRYDVDLDSSSEEHGSERHYGEEDSLRSPSRDEDSDFYSENEASASGNSATSSRSSPSSHSGDLFIPPSPPPAFVPSISREFDAFRTELASRQRQRQRLQEDLRHLREARRGITNPVRPEDAPQPVDFFFDHMPAPQRDAHGLLAQIEMDLERGRQQRRRPAPSPIRAPPPRPQQQREPPAVIDLTGDSDNEVLALPDSARFAERPNPFAPRDQSRSNSRRNNPARRAPSFARSDSSFLGPGAAPVIDLTSDAPEADPPPRLGPRSRRPLGQQNNEGPVDRARANAWGAANMNAIFRQMGIPRMGVDFLQQMRVALGGGQGDYEVEFIGENVRAEHPHMHRPLANFPIMENPLADNPVDFNYGANGFNHEPPARPKPAHIAPPEPREGFTRNTGEDTVVICPSCEEELQYDPDDKDGQQPPPAKKARTTKKDREEHHFWAVKACGHVSSRLLTVPHRMACFPDANLCSYQVYCRSCFENRRPSTKNGRQSSFQVVDKKLLCAVDDCTSDVTTKTAWVGIFL